MQVPACFLLVTGFIYCSLDFDSDVQKYVLNYENKLQRAIVGARNPENKETNETTLLNLIADHANSKFDYNSYLNPYLREKTRQVNAINIFYTHTVLQDEPQIAVFSLAHIPNALVSHQILFILTLNILPNVTKEKFTSWKLRGQEERDNFATWFNNKQKVGNIGILWREFRAFFHLNKNEVEKIF